ncbi:hypothetical protein SAMN05192558_11141 [Actinokineospora alba]|uniref:Uncharacterized protein n=1 Tax=Actinokineospora alba TaxID=504798 RepID=A0A1H0UAH1_9PSEU|nr:hypothetical protein [Actinokineospora alba]TDP65239.1 hypothetical protein C8E96_0718 [Actinokineospora alba]SDH57560.1 hypothetical protein SAMN05421871_101540 [Actinokineospora alba]SDP62998.1 hypothetical protein SAMN05192558_11141 [Actinokineospora alba]
MDPRERADAILARARARGSYVVTPESAISPMDASATLQIPRAVVNALDEDPDVTMVFPVTRAREELPAIAQEAATTSVASPGRPTERLPVQQPRPQQAPQQPQAPEQVDGLVPTMKPRPHPDRPTLGQRLDG